MVADATVSTDVDSSRLSPNKELAAVSVSETKRVKVGNMEQLEQIQANLSLRLNNEDAPMCFGCGNCMIRNGSCYKCLGCGNTSGCS